MAGASRGSRPTPPSSPTRVRTRRPGRRSPTGAGWDAAWPTSPTALYAAGPDSAFDLIRETDADVTTLVVIGHNPTMAYVAELLDDGEGDADATTGMVTAASRPRRSRCFAVDGAWSDLGPAPARLEAFHVGGA